jgi:hypothetical protein
MVENKESWKELLFTIDEHQRLFNEQLSRMHVENLVPDPESALLAPVKQYAESVIPLFGRDRYQFVHLERSKD